MPGSTQSVIGQAEPATAIKSAPANAGRTTSRCTPLSLQYLRGSHTLRVRASVTAATAKAAQDQPSAAGHFVTMLVKPTKRPNRISAAIPATSVTRFSKVLRDQMLNNAHVSALSALTFEIGR